MDKEVVIKSYETFLKMCLSSDADKLQPYTRSLRASSDDGSVNFGIRGTGSDTLLEIFDASYIAGQVLKGYNYSSVEYHYFIEVNELAQLLAIENLVITEGGR